MEQTTAYDVVVVGGGNAALCAAMAAREAGARVGVLEKAPRQERGGNSALTAQMRFVYNSVDDLRPLMPGASEQDLRAIAELLPRRTEADLWDEIMRATGGQSDPELLQVHVRESYPTVLWLSRKGHRWVPNYTEATAGNIVQMEGGGYGLQQRSFAVLEREGVTIHYETAALALVQDSRGRVVGVRALTPQGILTVEARAVVLACGGFESNAEMRARYLGPGWDTVKMRGVPYNTGDGLRMALEIGALPYGSWSSCHASPQDLQRPGFSLPSARSLGGREWNRYAYPFGLLVNVHGQRFVDEGEDIRALTYAKMGRAILAQPGGKAFQIFDAKAQRLGILKGYEQATGASADSLEALAAKLGIDAAGLVATVTAFNQAAPAGLVTPNPFRPDGRRTQGLTPPKSNYAMRLDEPPFFGYAVCCGITFTFGGLRVDPATAQVQHVAGRPIPGLYTAGEMLGGLWHWNYASGSGLMAGATFGRLAGTHAARAALEP
ncbi:MAG: tricarballylate dehydrogenase [Candidatus Tectimicrobiota bacterium]|nr:MAG: tricarballylate dehydrogenase [Candidatus Tectomicrobia bacterium]